MTVRQAAGSGLEQQEQLTIKWVWAARAFCNRFAMDVAAVFYNTCRNNDEAGCMRFCNGQLKPCTYTIFGWVGLGCMCIPQWDMPSCCLDCVVWLTREMLHGWRGNSDEAVCNRRVDCCLLLPASADFCGDRQFKLSATLAANTW